MESTSANKSVGNQRLNQNPLPLRRRPLRVLLVEERPVAVEDVEVVLLALPRRLLKSSTPRWLTTGRLVPPLRTVLVPLLVLLSQLPMVMLTWMTRSCEQFGLRSHTTSNWSSTVDARLFFHAGKAYLPLYYCFRELLIFITSAFC